MKKDLSTQWSCFAGLWYSYLGKENAIQFNTILLLYRILYYLDISPAVQVSKKKQKKQK